MGDDAWAQYVSTYHAGHAGITETAFEHARDVVLGTPHDWLAAAVPGPAGDVLDVACGSAAMHGRLTFDSYLGVDLSGSELDLARSRGRGPLVVADARRLPISTSTVDTVVCSMGLMLVQPVKAAVDEMARVLRPTGRIALLLPARRPLGRRDIRPVLTLATALRGPGEMPQRLGPRRICGILESAGFIPELVQRHRFAFRLNGMADVRLAVSSLYTPGRSPERLQRAQDRLSTLVAPHAEIGLPLLRVVARRGTTGSSMPGRASAG
jgi:SAM-dependent methyltransferase